MVLPPEPLEADLTLDTLIPPTQAPLTITSEPGFLSFAWETVPDQQWARIYKFDPAEEFEVLVAETNNTQARSIRLPSNTHQRAWYGEHFRVELCDANNCVSSARASIQGLEENSVQRLTPAVFVEGEQFAESVALNATASLMAVSLPVQGAIDLYARPDKLWTSMQRISVASDAQTIREIILRFSPSGDTLAALVLNDTSTPILKILERFGETWLETASLPITADIDAPETLPKAGSANSLSISENSNLMLIGVNSKAYTSYRSTSGWTLPTQLQHTEFQPLSVAFTEPFAKLAVLKAISSNLSHSRLISIHSFEQNLWISVWQQASEHTEAPVWHKMSAYAINNIDSTKDVSIHSDSSGERIVLAGWELNNSDKNTPVMWRYQIPDTNVTEPDNTAELSVIDSIRFPFSTENDARLCFSADDALERVALGWQRIDDERESSLMTYQFSSTAKRWLPKLELPDAFPKFAQQAYIRSALLSPNGEVMIISAGQFPTNANPINELLALQ